MKSIVLEVLLLLAISPYVVPKPAIAQGYILKVISSTVVVSNMYDIGGAEQEKFKNWIPSPPWFSMAVTQSHSFLPIQVSGLSPYFPSALISTSSAPSSNGFDSRFFSPMPAQICLLPTS